MKIPETGNVGAYYGNEENGQWQPNGVIIDNGVGGGVVGSGDAGVHRPPVYPVHMPRGPMPAGYVMAGTYYHQPPYPPVAAPQDDFADYMWMENEEEFDKQVMQQLEEEALMEQCIEAMLEDEQRERHRPVSNGHNHFATTSNGSNSVALQEAVSRSTLNPLAAEFVPSRARQPPEERQHPPEAKEETEATKEQIEPAREDIQDKEVSNDKEASPQTEPPEVSAADVQPIDTQTDEKSKEKTKPKPDAKKTKPEPAKAKAKKDSNKVKNVPSELKSVQSEVKSVKGELKSVQSEVKSVKSEVKSVASVDATCVKSEDEKEDSDISKQSSPPPSEDFGIKPINYAAAAKANKPKKSTTPPITETKTAPIKTEKPKEKKAVSNQPKTKAEKPMVQRKNSTK